jgi:hypothetical protein
MAKTYTAAGTVSAGDVATAAAFNVVTSDINNLIVPPMVSALRSANQSLTNATATAIQFNASDDFDTDAMHDTSTNNTRITVTTPGVYSFSLFASLEAIADATTTNPVLALYKNGSEIRSVRYPVKNGVDLRMSLTTLVEASLSGDYFELYVYQDSSTSKNVTSARFQAVWIGRTT